MDSVYAVILAGGSGTRFWPASRRLLPKQLLRITPGSSETLIESTIRRIGFVCPPERVLISTGQHLLEATQTLLPSVPAENFLGEPFARNTAPCIAWATSRIHEREPDAVVMVLPSDHHIQNEPAFLQAINTALDSARAGTITTIGLKPTRAETGYGYIHVGQEVAPGLRRVQRFVEKPDAPTAEGYVRGGEHLWNSGMFFFQVSAMLDAVRTHMPKLSDALDRIGAARRTREEASVLSDAFERLDSISIDYGIMEHAELNVVPADIGWSDLGSWASAWELAAKDQQGNALDAGTIAVESEGNLVRDLSSPEQARTVALLGMSDVCVVQTDDAVLVVPRERSQELRELVEQLKKKKPELL